MPAALVLMNPRSPRSARPGAPHGKVVLGSAVKAAIEKATKKVRSNPVADAKRAHREALRAAKVAQKAAERAGKVAGRMLAKSAPKPVRENPSEAEIRAAQKAVREGKFHSVDEYFAMKRAQRKAARKRKFLEEAKAVATRLGVGTPRSNPSVSWDVLVNFFMSEGFSREESEAKASKMGALPPGEKHSRVLMPARARVSKAKKASVARKYEDVIKIMMGTGMSRKEAEAAATRLGISKPRSNPSSRKVTQMARRPSKSRGGKRAIPAALMKAMRENPSLSWDTLIAFFMEEGATREEAEAKARKLGAKQPVGGTRERVRDQPDEANRERVRRANKEARQRAAEQAVKDGKFASTEEYFASKREASRARAKEYKKYLDSIMERYAAGDPTLTQDEIRQVSLFESRKGRVRSSSRKRRHVKNVSNLDKIFFGGEEKWPNTYRARKFANEHPSRYDYAGNLARAFVRIKKLENEPGALADPNVGLIAQELGLSALPNPYGESGGALLPMLAVSTGATILVWAATAKVSQMVKPKAPAALQRLVTPALAFGIGIGGAWLLKKQPSLAKFSGALLCGAVGTAVAAIMAGKGADGKSIEETYGLQLGDYHMGASMTVGDYHMGAVTQLNVGDYHMGAAPGIDVITDRRMLAPPGEPMPRHDTRRDNVDESITAFNGTLSGDIFDQA